MNELENLYNISLSVWGLSKDNNKGRNRMYVYARYMYYYFAREIKSNEIRIYPLKSIGSVIRSGGNDHSTVFYGAKVIEKFITIRDKTIYPKYLEMNNLIQKFDLSSCPKGILAYKIENMNVNALGLQELIDVSEALKKKQIEIIDILTILVNGSEKQYSETAEACSVL